MRTLKKYVMIPYLLLGISFANLSFATGDCSGGDFQIINNFDRAVSISGLSGPVTANRSTAEANTTTHIGSMNDTCKNGPCTIKISQLSVGGTTCVYKNASMTVSSSPTHLNCNLNQSSMGSATPSSSCFYYFCIMPGAHSYPTLMICPTSSCGCGSKSPA